MNKLESYDIFIDNLSDDQTNVFLKELSFTTQKIQSLTRLFQEDKKVPESVKITLSNQVDYITVNRVDNKRQIDLFVKNKFIKSFEKPADCFVFYAQEFQ